MARREIQTPFEIVEGKVVAGSIKVLVTVRQGKGADAVELVKDMPHVLDYAGCELNDILDSAAANDVVSLQNGVWRGMGSAVTQEAGKATKMAEYYARETTRAPVDPGKAVLKAADSGKLSQEELAELIKQLQARAGALV